MSLDLDDSDSKEQKTHVKIVKMKATERFLHIVNQAAADNSHPIQFTTYPAGNRRCMMYQCLFICKYMGISIKDTVSNTILNDDLANALWPQILAMLKDNNPFLQQFRNVMLEGRESFESWYEEYIIPQLYEQFLWSNHRKHLAKRAFNHWKFMTRRPGTTLYQRWMMTDMSHWPLATQN